MRRRHRLTHKRQFRDLRRPRISATRGCLRVGARPNGGLPLRAGFAITGVRMAVSRNRLRRRLRALLQDRVATLTGVDVLVAAGPAAATATFLQIGADLDACLDEVVLRATDASSIARCPAVPSVTDNERCLPGQPGRPAIG